MVNMGGIFINMTMYNLYTENLSSEHRCSPYGNEAKLFVNTHKPTRKNLFIAGNFIGCRQVWY